MDTFQNADPEAAAASSDSIIDLPPIIGSAQCAALLQCSRKQVALLANNGTLPAIKIGRGWIAVPVRKKPILRAYCRQGWPVSRQQMPRGCIERH